MPVTQFRRPPSSPTIDWPSRNVVNVRFAFASPSDSFTVLITSDVHLDNSHCDQGLFKAHLDEAKDRNALWMDNGDLFCLMQGKWDPRSDQESLRSIHRGNNYLDRVLDSTAEFLKPYAHMIVGLGHGNHETSILNRHGVDMTERLCGVLSTDKHTVRCHGYSGWYLFRCKRGENGQGQTINLYRHHGYGGGAPVTKGTIQTARVAPQFPDADVVVMGHDHNEWIFPIPRKRITQNGVLYQDEQLHLRIPGYKDGIGDGYGSWEVQQGHAIKGKGAIWLTFTQGSARHNRRFLVEARRAK